MIGGMGQKYLYISLKKLYKYLVVSKYFCTFVLANDKRYRSIINFNINHLKHLTNYGKDFLSA